MPQYQPPQRSKRILTDLFELSDELENDFTRKIFRQLTDLARAELEKTYDKLQRDADGNIAENNSDIWVAQLAALESGLLNVINSPQYNKTINDYLLDFEKVKAKSHELHTELNGIVDYAKADAELAPKQRYIMDKVIYELKQGGIKSLFVEPTKQILLNAITFGRSITQVRQEVNKLYAESTDLHTGRINSYIGQIARDAIYTYNGAINETIANAYGLDGIAYVGGVVADSRPFCIHYHGAEIAKKDLNGILTRYLGSESLSSGMYKVSVSDYEANFLIYRGGWNCRHIAIPIRLNN